MINNEDIFSVSLERQPGDWVDRISKSTGINFKFDHEHHYEKLGPKNACFIYTGFKSKEEVEKVCSLL